MTPPISYEVAYLTAHLEAAGDIPRLHHLLSLERDGHTNVWHAIKEQEDDAQGYFDDLMRAWRHALPGRPGADAATQLAHQCRYALMRASIHSREESIAPELVVQLALCGRWSLKRALAHVRALSDSRERIESICRLMPALTPKLQEQLFGEAIADIERLRGRAPFPNAYRDERVSHLCTLFEALSTPKPAYALAALSQELEAQELPLAVQRLVSALLPCVEECEIPRLLYLLDRTIEPKAKESLAELWDRLRLMARRLTLLARLTQRLPASDRPARARDVLAQVRRLLDATHGMTSLYIVACLRELGSSSALVEFRAVVNYLFQEALSKSETSGLQGDLSRIRLAARILPLCSPPQQKVLASHVISGIPTWGGSVPDFESLVEEIALWPEHHREGLFESVLLVRGAFDRFSLLVTIASVLPEEKAYRAVDAAIGLLARESWSLEEIVSPALVAALCDKMNEQERHLLRSRIAASKVIKRQMQALAAYFAASSDTAERASVLREVVQLTDRDRSEGYQESPLRLFLGIVGGSLSADEAVEMLVAARTVRGDSAFLFALAEPLALLEESAREMTVQWALEIAARSEAFAVGTWLSYIAAWIPESCYVRAHALAVGQRDRAKGAMALAALLKISGLSADQRSSLCREALTAVDAVERDRERIPVLAMIGRGCSDEAMRLDLSARVLDALEREDYPSVRSQMLADAVSLFPTEDFVAQCRDVLAAAEARKEVNFRDALVDVAPLLPLDVVLEMRSKFLRRDYEDSDQARVAVARRLAQLGRPAQALELITPLSPGSLADALATMAALLPDEETIAAVAMAERIDHHWRDKAFAALAARLAAQGQCDIAMDCLEQIKDPESVISGAAGVALRIGEPERSRLLARVPDRLRELTAPLQSNLVDEIVPALVLCDDEPRARLFAGLLDVVARNTRAALVPQLYKLAPVLHAVGGPSAVADLMRSIRQTARWWP